MDTLRSLSVSDLRKDNDIGQIYDKYHAGLLGFLRTQLISKEDAEDLAQEVFLRLVRYENLKELKSPWSFLRKIASNLMKDKFRRQRFREADAHIPFDDIQIASPTASPEQAIVSKERIDELNTLLKSMTEDCQTVFTLSRFGGLTYDEIARETGISIHMVRKHISRVLKELRKTIAL